MSAAPDQSDPGAELMRLLAAAERAQAERRAAKEALDRAEKAMRQASDKVYAADKAAYDYVQTLRDRVRVG